MERVFYVYILNSQKTGRYYVGSTQNIEKRVQEHNEGKTPSTRSGVPWELVRVGRFESRSEAIRQERRIKLRRISRYLESLQINKQTGCSAVW
ncbi:MAG: GIY-YIG nuclease family protein [Lentisphaerae bacterium]|nr:GIY-YIG nuclease family protein [Lentisphaerota bacterium]